MTKFVLEFPWYEICVRLGRLITLAGRSTKLSVPSSPNSFAQLKRKAVSLYQPEVRKQWSSGWPDVGRSSSACSRCSPSCGDLRSWAPSWALLRPANADSRCRLRIIAAIVWEDGIATVLAGRPDTKVVSCRLKKRCLENLNLYVQEANFYFQRQC